MHTRCGRGTLATGQVKAIGLLLVLFLALSGGPRRIVTQVPGAFDPLSGSLARNEAQAVYAADPSDPWNVLFHLLFTRTIQARVVTHGQAMFLTAGDARLALAEGSVTRIESGDRAIDPLYPSWLGSADISPEGSWSILTEPRYAQLVAALAAVTSSAAAHPPLARALMQADLWAMHDILHAASAHPPLRLRPVHIDRTRRIEALLPPVAQAIHALALTRTEIEHLPDTYHRARRAHDLPDLFGPDSGWMEIRWLTGRVHERAVNDRRAVRVFLKPERQSADPSTLLHALREGHGDHHGSVSAAALVTQLLLVSTDGTAVPSPITYQVQIRSTPPNRITGGALLQYDLSRRALLTSPEHGGLVAMDESTPAYLPGAGNDFSFATPPALGGYPVLAPLRQRCLGCHDPGMARLSTFAMITAPGFTRAVERLNPLEHTHPADVAARKMTREDFMSLRRAGWP